MKHRPRWLIVVAVVAVLVESVGVVGWLSWRRVVRMLEDRPAEGAVVLAENALVRLPSAVRRSRRIPTRELSKAQDDLVVASLLALSRSQMQWAPADPAGFTNRSRAELIGGSLDQAKVDLDAAIVRYPTSPDLHWLMALTERSRGENAEALDHLATSAGLGARDRPLRMDLTPEETAWVRIEGLERRLDYYPRARSQGVIALAREHRKRDEARIGRAYLEGDSKDPRIVLELARWDLDDGLTDEAEDRLDGLADRSGLPAALHAETWAVMATVRDRQGDAAGAVAAADMALTYDPRSAAPYRVLAGLAERRGDVAEALEHLRRAWGMNPTDVSLLLSVARTAEKAGEIGDARLALERAKTADPSNPNLAAALVEFYLRQGEFMDATVTLSDALDRFPTNPRLLGLADRLRSEVRRR
jgi:tetratricopeptide (TPR) repeat protein